MNVPGFFRSAAPAPPGNLSVTLAARDGKSQLVYGKGLLYNKVSLCFVRRAANVLIDPIK